VTGLGIDLKAELFFIRIFLLYLLIVACISIVRLVRIAYRVRPVGVRKPVTLEKILTAAFTPEQVAEAALKNQLSLSVSSGNRSGSSHLPLSSTDVEAMQVTLKSAESRFSYLWKRTHLMVKSTEKLAWLTFLSTLLTGLVSATFFANGIFLFSTGEASRIPLGIIIRENITLLFARLSLGLTVCLLIYLQSTLLEGLMQRRRILWEDFVQRMKDELRTSH
jgi:hypothetical protein